MVDKNMSSLISDSGASADLNISSRVVAVVSATSAAAVAASAFVGPSSQTEVKNSCKQLEQSVSSSIGCSDVTDVKNNYDDEDILLNGTGNTLNISLMQTSPPPHSYRHSRAYRHFKNPPQPHMCIRTTTESGEELFINVLSWTRIVIPQEPTDPIPLYGGMRVPPGSPRSPPIVFAVMANPEVLKDSGRHSKDPEERRAMVELMCDFVEAMNPGVKLVRNAVILKDRDISGELKDVWNAVQAQRDREREEQMFQQRQQQHFHNVTTQQMFPKATEYLQTSDHKQSNNISSEKVDKISLDRLDERSMVVRRDYKPSDFKNIALRQDFELDKVDAANEKQTKESSEFLVNSLNEQRKCGDEYAFSAPLNGKDQIDATKNINESIIEASVKTFSTQGKSQTIKEENCEIKGVQPTIDPISPSSKEAAAANIKNTIAGSTPITTSNSTKDSTSVPANASTPSSTKKDKLVGFLPNGCIFPRFKNYKNKEKDKEKETKTKDKEKTLLNALKKSKDKKMVTTENGEKTSVEKEPKINYEKNCINLESEVQKMDLNKIETPTSGDLFVKLKMPGTSATAK